MSTRRIAVNRTVIRPKQVWQFDLTYRYDHGDNRFFFVLVSIDEFTRKVVENHFGLTCNSGDFIFALNKALREEDFTDKGRPAIGSDSGPKMSSTEL